MLIEGKLRVWFTDRGFGFIDGEFEQKIRRSIYCHAKSIRSGVPLPGALATFRVVYMPKGPAAFDVVFPPAPNVSLSNAAVELLERKILEETLVGVK